MHRICKCGGRPVPQHEVISLYTKERFATFKCDKCGKQYRQKKRQVKAVTAGNDSQGNDSKV